MARRFDDLDEILDSDRPAISHTASIVVFALLVLALASFFSWKVERDTAQRLKEYENEKPVELAWRFQIVPEDNIIGIDMAVADFLKEDPKVNWITPRSSLLVEADYFEIRRAVKTIDKSKVDEAFYAREIEALVTKVRRKYRDLSRVESGEADPVRVTAAELFEQVRANASRAKKDHRYAWRDVSGEVGWVSETESGSKLVFLRVPVDDGVAASVSCRFNAEFPGYHELKTSKIMDRFADVRPKVAVTIRGWCSEIDWRGISFTDCRMKTAKKTSWGNLRVSKDATSPLTT